MHSPVPLAIYTVILHMHRRNKKNSPKPEFGNKHSLLDGLAGSTLALFPGDQTAGNAYIHIRSPLPPQTPLIVLWARHH